MSKYLNESLSGRDNNFDFIRFVSALAVIFSHSFDLTSNYDKEPLRVFSNGDSSIGEIAVAIFFVTSGFLIVQSYNRTQSVYKYFFSRFLRIYPGLIFVILCTIFIIGPSITSLGFTEYFWDIKTIKYLFNITLIKISFHLPGVFESNPFPRDAVNGSLWSLPFEILCYILVALFGAIAKREYSIIVVLTLVALMFLLFMPVTTLFTCTYYFLCGSLVYVNRTRVILNWGIFLLLLFTLPINLAYNPSFVFKVIISGISLSYIIIFLAAFKISSLHNFSKYGDFSYGLYVWGFPIQQIIAFKYSSLGNYYNFLTGSVLTLIIAYFSWHFIEKRALLLKNYPIEKQKPFFMKHNVDNTIKKLAEAEEV